MANSEKINLPGTPQEIASLFKDDSIPDEVKSTIRKYSGGGLISGRPLDSLQIILSGYSGSGKSSTINFLFDDPALCKISSSTSETRDPVMVQKRLVCCQAKGPQVEGTLSLVDLPGQFDSDNKRDVCNLASTLKFLDSMFASREGITISDLKSSKIRPTVYPNLVLFVITATDNRLQGNSTNLRKALMVIQKTGNLVDIEHPNLIILITHACSLGLHATYFNEDLNEKKTIIRQVINEVFGISDVDIIPIENRPERYQLEKCGDYYKLPNEELSHYNLYQAMLKRMERNNDHIGQLFANWYFQSSCPEKQSSAEAILPTLDVDYSDLAKAAAELHILQKGTDPINPVSIFKFECLGYGYCPATEKLKPSLLSKRIAEDVQIMKEVEIKGNKFMIPKYVSETVMDSGNFQRLTFLSKSDYQDHMKMKYGIDKTLELNMITGSDCKWMNDLFDRRGIRRLAFSQEVQVCKFKLDFPPKFFKESVFYKELSSLPVDYDSEENAKKFLAFFAKWGTHLIYEEDVGGSMELKCTIKQSMVSQDNIRKIKETVEYIFTNLFVEPSTKITSLTKIYDRVSDLRTLGVIQESLEFQGGNVPEYIEWDTATFDDVDKWQQSIPQKPVELKKSIKLIPYYDLLAKMDEDNPRFKSLFQATKRYMEEPGSSCFPKYTRIQMASGESKTIEQLSACGGKLQTVGISGVTAGISMKLKSLKRTAFCTFLDKRSDEFVTYLVFQFSNDRKLTVSPGHMIFQYLPGEKSVVGKQAKDFEAGDMAVFVNKSGSIEYPVIGNISQEVCLGAYSPLTMSGTFIADGFLVSSYADIDSFTVAEGALLPLKMWCKLSGNKGNNSSSELEATIQRNGIHPYAKFLMSIRKLVSSHFTPK